KDSVCSSVLMIGVPAALGSMLMSVSQMAVNSRMASYDDMAVAAMGVAMKVVIITGMICMGIGQGVQPLLGYCTGARLWDRFRKVMRFSLLFALGLGILLAFICIVFTRQIVGAFLTDVTAFDYAVNFARILLTTSFLFGVFYVMINSLQAMGAATPALIVNLSRQGIIFIPVMFLLEAVMGMTGLVWAQPVADLASLVLAAVLYLRKRQQMM
ncbi:MAG: MATE family efflux transporter, partial [Anaerovoracaceae bacterium]